MSVPVRGPAGPTPPETLRSGPGPAEIVPLAAIALWLAAIGWLALSGRVTIPQDVVGIAILLLAALLPVALLCIAAALARLSRTLRIERRTLAAEIEAIRANAMPRRLEARLDAVARSQAALAEDLSALRVAADAGPDARLRAPGRPADVRPGRPADVRTVRFLEAAPGLRDAPQLDLEAAPDGDPLPPEDVIRALDFPDDEADEAGFHVLRAALRHRPTARLANTAQDVLLRLAEDGIYMDDLDVQPADPVLWRAFAAGARGAEVAGIGGIRDRSSLALTAARMRDDSTSRDAIHRFLRTFDTVFAEFAATASDPEVIRFADTRTARAFMLCARVTGVFDPDLHVRP